MNIRIAANGRMVLPRKARDAMGLSGDTKVSVVIEDDVVRLEPYSHRLRRARDLYRDAVERPRSTDDFLADRREEAAREGGGESGAPR